MVLCWGGLDGTHRWILIALCFPPRVLETALLERWPFIWLIIRQWLLKRWPTEPIRWQEWACRLLAHKLLFPSEQTFQLFSSSGNSDVHSECKAPQDRNLPLYYLNMKNIKMVFRWLSLSMCVLSVRLIWSSSSQRIGHVYSLQRQDTIQYRLNQWRLSSLRLKVVNNSFNVIIYLNSYIHSQMLAKIFNH